MAHMLNQADAKVGDSRPDGATLTEFTCDCGGVFVFWLQPHHPRLCPECKWERLGRAQ